MPFTTLSDEEEKELYRLQRFYWHEALRCEESKAYLAGFVMLGSALETLLILMVNCYPDEAQQAWQAQMKRKPKLWFAIIPSACKKLTWNGISANNRGTWHPTCFCLSSDSSDS